jgi:hypothetical protein
MNDEQNISASNASTGKQEAQPINDLQAAEINSNLLTENPVTQKPGDKETIEPVEPETINPPPQTEEMELHHHGHVHEKKKWKEYVFQFFMLFLAVFCGFLAEYQLEHKIETDREKQFIQSLINDIKADTVRVKVIINERMKRDQRLDSLTFLLNNELSKGVTNRIYVNAVTAARSLAFRFIPNDGTMQQLKNSGAFRLIRNRTVSDSIAKYDVSIRNLLRQGELEESLIHDYRVASAKIFDALVFDRSLDADNNMRTITENPPLLNYNDTDLHTWNYKMYSMKALNKANRRDMKLLFQQAANLLETLKTEYHLE